MEIRINPKRRPRVYLNARFRQNQDATGVARYSAELATLYDFIEVCPSKVFRTPILSVIWEQIWLPLRTLGRPLVNPGNSAPVFKRRQVVVIHDLAPIVMPGSVSNAFRFKFKITMFAARRIAATIATVSETVAIEISNETGRSDILVIPNFIRPAPVAEYQPRVPNYFLVVGSKDPRKNFNTVKQAYAESGLHQEGVGLVSVGASRSDIFNESSAPAVTAGHTEVGFVSDADLRELMAGALALVYVPAYEGFGRPPLEAMSLGTPVIVSGIPVLREVCGEAALYVAPSDPSNLAEVMYQAWRQPEVLGSISRRGRDRCALWSESRARHALLIVLDSL